MIFVQPFIKDFSLDQDPMLKCHGIKKIKRTGFDAYTDPSSLYHSYSQINWVTSCLFDSIEIV